MSREVRWLARELRPAPTRRRSRVLLLVGWVLRHLPEILAVWLAYRAWMAVADRIGQRWTAVAAGVLLAGVVAWPRSRRWLLAGLGCLVTRYRLRTALRELRLTTRAGRLPLTLAIVPTPVGERVWLVCPVGVAAEDLADETDRLRAACYAREVRITRDRRWSALVTVDVIRRDPLAATKPIPSPLAQTVRAVVQEVEQHG